MGVTPLQPMAQVEPRQFLQTILYTINYKNLTILSELST